MSLTLLERFEGTGLEYNGGTGGVKRRFTLQGLAKAPTNPSDNYGLAVQSVGLPRYADPHPTIVDLYVSGFASGPLVDREGSSSKNDIYIDVNYSVPTASQPLGGVYCEVYSSNGQIIKNRWEAGDQAGQPILVGYKVNVDTNGADPNTSFADQIDPAFAIANLDASVSGMSFDTASFPTESPNVIVALARMEKSAITPLKYRRTVNSTVWQGFDPLTVLCREVRASKVFGIGFVPNHFVVEYIFEAAPDPTYWEHVEIYRDWQTGKAAIVNLLDGTNNGYTIVGKAQTDFNELAFPNNLLIAS